jgi:hypothetical protein
MANLPTEACANRAFSVLPLELFLNVLDELVGTRDGQQPVAYGPRHASTVTLRNLTLVSRDVYPIASRYLYSYCLCLISPLNFAKFRRTLGLHPGSRTQALEDGEPRLSNELSTNIPRYITSAFIAPMKIPQVSTSTPLVPLLHIIGLCMTIGLTLKRLALDLGHFYVAARDIDSVRPHLRENNIFLQMPLLEELIASYNVPKYFPYAPLNLKRLAITCREIRDTQVDFCFSISSLETLILLRPRGLRSADIDRIFSSYKGKSLDVILVDVNSNHRTPNGARNTSNNDAVRMWEMDVPVSFYGDANELVLCDDYIWTHGVGGTLWQQSKRRMASWADIQKRLAGPVHTIIDSVTA